MELHDTNIVDLKTFPVMTKSAEAVRAKVDQYLDRMRQVGRTPSRIVLFAHDYNTIFGAIKKRREAAYRDTGKSPPPSRGARLRRAAGHVRREGVNHAS